MLGTDGQERRTGEPRRREESRGEERREEEKRGEERRREESRGEERRDEEKSFKAGGVVVVLVTCWLPVSL